MNRSSRLLSLIPLVALLSVILIAYAPLAFTDRILARGDTFTYFYPYWDARSEAFRAGTLPLWSPELFMGVPLLANSQIGTFYPPNGLVTPFSAPQAVKISILLHVTWAAFGAYALARRGAGLSRAAAFTAGVIFALGGVIGAHVEQINQLQGLSWMPWLFWFLIESARHGHKAITFALLLAGGLAMQFLSGHTQTVFITGVGLGIAALIQGRRVRSLLTLIAAGGLALVLAAPQLIPTLELTRLSNRSGGLTPNEVTAFSFNPFVAGRGLLPSDDQSIFTEYVAYIGVIGIGLALIGLVFGGRSDTTEAAIPSRRWLWAALAVIGLFFAFGLYNPLYWWIAQLPGFNLFRVPARWLALFALGAAMLAAIGVQSIQQGARPRWRVILPFGVIVGTLALSTRFVTASPDRTPISLPETITWIAWGAAAVLFVGAMLLRRVRWGWIVLIAGVTVELIAANGALPSAQTVPAEAWSAQRFTISQIRAYNADAAVPDRMLSISQTMFDPGDHASLEARYTALGLSAEALRSALVAVKLKEVIAPNLPLAWGIPTIDGYDGGLLPTRWYTDFASLLLPEGSTVDGRLRELLALEDCRGACIPDQRWLDLTNTRYLVVDKVFDLWYDGIAYDTALARTLSADETIEYGNVQAFPTDAVDVLVLAPDGGMTTPSLGVEGAEAASDPVAIGTLSGGTAVRSRYALSQTNAIDPVRLSGTGDHVTVLAVTLVNTATGNFQQLAPEPFTRVLSSDIKIYENANVSPRAFVVYNWSVFPDTPEGDRALHTHMRTTDFDPRAMVDVSGTIAAQTGENAADPQVTVDDYRADQVQITVTGSSQAALLVLTDAYYPGWAADVNDQPAPIYRADGMFRAVPIPAGDSTIRLTYQPTGLATGLGIGAAGWLVVLVGLVAFSQKSKHRTNSS